MVVSGEFMGSQFFDCFYPDCPKNRKGEPDNSGVGCGAYVWPFLLKDTRFYPACEWHDRATMDGSAQQEMFSRWVVDRTFLHHLLQIAGPSWWHRARAYLFYGIARALGGFFWEGKQQITKNGGSNG